MPRENANMSCDCIVKQRAPLLSAPLNHDSVYSRLNGEEHIVIASGSGRSLGGGLAKRNRSHTDLNDNHTITQKEIQI